MKQNYNDLGIITEDFPPSTELYNYTRGEVQAIIQDRSAFGNLKVEPILSYESFWLPMNPKEVLEYDMPVFNNFFVNYFGSWGSSMREYENFELYVVSLEEEFTCNGELYTKELRERILSSSRAFFQFRSVFPDLDNILFSYFEYRGPNEYKIFPDEIKRALYSAYCRMRTEPGVSDYGLFA